MSLRLKFVIVIVVSVVIAVLTVGAVVRQSAAHAEDDRVRNDAQKQLAQAKKVLETTGVLTLDGVINDPQLPESAQASARDGHVVTVRGSKPDSAHPGVWAAGPVTVGNSSQVLSVYLSTEDSHQLLDRIDKAILLSSLGAAFVIGGVGSLVAGTISRRLVRGAQVAKRIGAGDTSQKISDVIETGHDEVTDFAIAVDSAVEKLAQRVESERRFTADLAHEMRTPLTGLLNAANLLEENSRPAELVRDRAKAMQELVEDLLEVSRLEAGKAHIDMQPMNVALGLQSLITTLRSSGVLHNHTINTDFTAADVVITTDQRRFERIVSNLVLNSIRHGADPITVTADATALRVEDCGPGYPSDILTLGPTRFVSSGGGGMGLGLVIAQGQATVLILRLRFSNRPEGGARTDLRWADHQDPAE